ncbi:MAG: DNA repair protein RadA [Candidatus Omnitrophica bacterium]|nr:DNA repair protein RadA [Candidatus Omnitrophota bacterium]
MKTKTIYACQNCGAQSAKWSGRCADCGSWNSFVEENYSEPTAKTRSRAITNSQPPVLLKDVSVENFSRAKTGISELDRVLGGGIVPGSVVLIGGDPGIGKSTICLQICAGLSAAGKKVLYISGEESVSQTKLRAERLAPFKNAGELFIVNQTDIGIIEESIKKLSPDMVVVDSIQVVFNPEFDSSPGSVSQVRDCAGYLTRIAKTEDIAMFIIGHVTKQGTLAGPRVLEHIVDTVLYFEGDRYSAYRVLRAQKNRFGSTNEIGVFEMTSSGLKEVDNPSCIFLSERAKNVSGSAVSSVLEGTRPLLVEIQALTSRANFGYAARRAQGFDHNRLNLLIAVLEKRIGLHLETEDVFLNVAGGVKVADPACDLAVVAAIASSFKDKPILEETVVFGEVGLTSEVRSANQIELRINEAEKLGFKRCILPRNNLKNASAAGRRKIELIGAASVKEALDILVG